MKRVFNFGFVLLAFFGLSFVAKDSWESRHDVELLNNNTIVYHVVVSYYGRHRAFPASLDEVLADSANTWDGFVDNPIVRRKVRPVDFSSDSCWIPGQTWYQPIVADIMDYQGNLVYPDSVIIGFKVVTWMDDGGKDRGTDGRHIVQRFTMCREDDADVMRHYVSKKVMLNRTGI